MKPFKMTMLVSSITVSMLMFSSASASPKQIGDLEIYQAAQGTGGGTIMMMLDLSGSMNRYDAIVGGTGVKREQKNCRAGVNHHNATTTINIIKKVILTDENGEKINYNGSGFINGELTYELQACNAGTEGQPIFNYNRISKLKKALIELLADGTALGEQYNIGLGVFPATTESPGYGQIRVAADSLTVEQRIKLINKIEQLTLAGNTPTAAALAEAGAYMFGTTTGEIGRESKKTTIGSYTGQPFEMRLKGFYLAGKYNNGYSWVFDPQNIDSIREPMPGYAGQYKYKSPITTKNSECGGYGVYLLTDGEPNNAGPAYTYSTVYAQQVMAKSLNKTPPYTPNTDQRLECKAPGFHTGFYDTGNNNDLIGPSGWQCIGAYTKRLNSTNNPAGTAIKVATVGFGSTFTNNLTKTITIQTPKGEREIQDCRALGSDSYNLCKLGELKGTYTKADGSIGTTGGYGEGGFVATAESEAIKESLTNFASEITQIISTTPSGTITVPNDPLSVGSLQPYAYLPMLEPRVGSNDIVWPGNLKRYIIKSATLFGKDNKRLYKAEKANGFPYLLNSEAQDLWMTGDGPANDIHQGGVYAKLKAPDTNNQYSVRNVWVEDIQGGKAKLVKIGVNSSGKLIGFNDLQDAVYTPVAKAYLLNFLGYNVSVNPATYSTNVNTNNTTLKAKVTKELEDQITPPTQPIKVLGGVVHSKPTLVSYGGKFNAADKDADGDNVIDADAGLISNADADRDDYLLFGSMEGALHLVDAASGEENIAVIPRNILVNQMAALKENTTQAAIDRPKFGVDAPWMSSANYKLDLAENGSVKADKMYAYGGLRMGGEGLYGLDLTNKNTPALMFSIERGKGGTFNRLGQTWKEPLLAKIKTGTGPDDTRDVLIFGGGYDMCYESPSFTLVATGSSATDVCTNKASAYGNAVYMVDAKSGEKIWSWSGDKDGDSRGTIVPDMKHSVVGSITVLDRNDNGTIDHLYFADLGGQVFRVDLQEGKTGSEMAVRTVKVFDANKDVKTKDKQEVKNHIAFRFYEQPIVSFYDNNQERFAVVNIASGDRSSPLSEDRSIEDANRVYGIMDRDIAQQNLYADNFKQITQNLGNGDLVRLPFDNSSAKTSREAVVASMQAGSKGTGDKAGRLVYAKQGWYYPLTRFDGYDGIKYVKSMGEGRVVGSIYYMTTYTPLMNYGSKSSCSAKIQGGSERQLYCMPYGICNQKDSDGNYLSSNGTGGFTRAGPGIQELVLGPISDTQRNTSTLLGTQTISELVQQNDRINYGEGMSESDVNKLNVTIGKDGVTKVNADGTAPQIFHSESFRLLPKRWYELQNNE